MTTIHPSKTLPVIALIVGLMAMALSCGGSAQSPQAATAPEAAMQMYASDERSESLRGQTSSGSAREEPAARPAQPQAPAAPAATAAPVAASGAVPESLAVKEADAGRTETVQGQQAGRQLIVEAWISLEVEEIDPTVRGVEALAGQRFHASNRRVDFFDLETDPRFHNQLSAGLLTLNRLGPPGVRLFDRKRFRYGAGCGDRGRRCRGRSGSLRLGWPGSRLLPRATGTGLAPEALRPFVARVHLHGGLRGSGRLRRLRAAAATQRHCHQPNDQRYDGQSFARMYRGHSGTPFSYARYTESPDHQIASSGRYYATICI